MRKGNGGCEIVVLGLYKMPGVQWGGCSGVMDCVSTCSMRHVLARCCMWYAAAGGVCLYCKVINVG